MASKKTWYLQNTEDPDVFGTGSMDIVYDSGGRVVSLTGREKLQFLALKCVLTGRYNEEGFSYGSTISRLLGLKAQTGNELVDSLYAMATDRALRALKALQPSDLDPTEEMARLDGDVLVARDIKDRTILYIRAAIRSSDDTVIPIIHSFKII